MMVIFCDLTEKGIEVFMDDFSVFGTSFESCLKHLSKVLKRCEETNLVLNWEKCQFMVIRGIVFRHHISENGMKVDPAKIQVISNLPCQTNVREIMSFLGHAGFYRRYIKDFSKISKPLCHLLEKDAIFNFDEEFLKAFKLLKVKLITAPIIVSPSWEKTS